MVEKINLLKPVGGAVLGVTIPIAIEYAAKGARISEGVPLKWSGVIGTVAGGIEIGLAVAGSKGKIGWPKEPGDVAFMAALGGAKLATGVSILILDELRKRALYTFQKNKKGTRLPTGGRGMPSGKGLEELQRVEYPIEELVEEI